MGINRMLWVAAGIGAVAGMRTLTAPAAATAYRRADQWREREGARGMRSAAPAALMALAAVEMVMDKRSSTPARVRPGALAARAASGAWSAGALAARRKHRPVGYAALGGAAAVVGAYGFYLLRRGLGRRLGIPDYWLGAAEDLLAITAAARLPRR